MGNDIDVMSQDSEFEDTFWKNHGPKNESTYNFLKRGFNHFTNNIANPQRSDYSIDKSNYPEYDCSDFSIYSQGSVLKCFQWRSLQSCKRCIVYFHTNTRNLSDACEVIPIAKEIHAHVIAMDMPGAGKSQGKVHTKMHFDVATLVEWVTCLHGDDCEIILWSRGMSTAPVIEYCSQIKRLAKKPNIKCVVLDSPFESIEKMVSDYKSKVKSLGYDLPETLLAVFMGISRRVIASHIKADPYTVIPINAASSVEIPAIILANENDDYIPSAHSLNIAAAWKGPTIVHLFQSTHFGERPSTIMRHATAGIKLYVSES